jgi:hypothetical protein
MAGGHKMATPAPRTEKPPYQGMKDHVSPYPFQG